MAWICLIIAGILEVAWAFYMKQSEGFTRLLPSLFTIILMLASFALLSISMKSLPLGTAYAIWTGIGALGTFVIGIMFLGEAANPLRLLSALFILMGLIGLKLTSK